MCSAIGQQAQAPAHLRCSTRAHVMRRAPAGPCTKPAWICTIASASLALGAPSSAAIVRAPRPGPAGPAGGFLGTPVKVSVALALAILSAGALAPARAEVGVDLELVLAIDASGSVDL